ncbi:MAG: 16S rRNA processing protein RimM [uncultured Campylobacterales bacterium]|uniref:Ribosome maturation factor RimM n=1 Tax=uncultured Campylobacterales bacterium TaxID=352960 RepID=A0A6S6SBL2_9BACT|nr:MAG: 16S rRNA processing protein RimM [uncultured Campylobacterales bacterium]
MSTDDLVAVATIGKSVGLKGELKLHIISDFKSQFKKNRTYYFEDHSKIVIENFNQNNNRVKFYNYDDIDIAKTLTNKNIYSTKKESSKNLDLRENEFLWFELIGYTIIENHKVLGTISTIDRISDIDYLLINTDEEFQKIAKRFCLPYDKKYIIEVDSKNRIIKTKNAYDILENS